tara:strand:- start:4266 stop:5111 length:846 start_codon:yes stop_codon:yes gene_type:complete
MDKSLENYSMNESHDYEWDFKNNKTKGEFVKKTNTENNTVEWLKTSLEKAKNKVDWYRRLLTKISSLNPKLKKIILLSIIPLLIGLISNSDIDDIAKEGGVEYSLIHNIINNNKDINKTKSKIKNKSFSKFIKDVAFRESSGRWNVSNDGGYMGLYQIGRTALKDVDQRTKDPELKELHKKISKKKFDNDPNIFPAKLQTKVFKQLLRNNKHYLRNFYKYIGQNIGGIEITESGLLGGSHLVGHRGVKKFLRSGGKKDDKDGNGVKCSEYLKLFSNYEIDL